MKSLFNRLFTVTVGLGIALPPTVAQVSLERMPFVPTNTTLLAQTPTNRTEREKLIQQVNVLIRQGAQQTEPRQAIATFQQILTLARQLKVRKLEAYALLVIGLKSNILGQHQQALDYSNQALLIFREVKDRSDEAIALNTIGDVYPNTGQLWKALDYFQQALPIFKEVGDRSGEATTLTNIGGVYDNIGQPLSALDYYQQALPIVKEVGDRAREAAILNNIGKGYYNIGQPMQALDYYQQALSIAKSVNNRSGEATTLSNIGLVYQDTNQPDEAIATWKESIEITLSIRRNLTRDNRKAFIAVNDSTAIALIDLLIKQKQPKEAFKWANLVTTFDLADYTRLINAKVSNLEAQKEIDRWKELNNSLNFLLNQQEDNKQQGKYSIELAQRINEIQAQANKKADNMYRRFPEVAELFETKPTDIDRLQQNLPQNTVLIQPVLLTGVDKVSNTLAIFVLTKDQITVIPKTLPENLDFEQLVTDFRQQLESISSYQDTSEQLYNLLIRPVEERFSIPSGYQIAIIATGKLRNIPFEALYDGQNEKFLLEKYPVSYLTRLSKTQNLSGKINPQRQSLAALVMANPKPTQQELAGTEAEADYIMQNFPDSRDYRHEQATLDRFKNEASRFSILHLGTHGCFVAKGCSNGMKENTLLFANNQQYPITDAALLGLTNTELLVLSACQTAQVTEIEGVGLSGLAYVWERAGAKSIIASLWIVSDQKSSEMMTQFYAKLKQGMSKAEAMRQAKLSLIKKNKHPFLWSPFILIGDAR